ncbi:tetratricopeptide repeat protein [Butyricimonas synergistica]|uniref:tetratricopeptide repeat protein n=1 Tax=Butyricimonas synergistica TaxID=544644 RepID=UPI0003748453|nr:tetratricopeptide repeat protein [Butyricimonas synergistica]
MTKWISNIVNSVSFIGLLLLLATIVVIDAESMNGIAVAKRFWFYIFMCVTGVLSIILAFYKTSTTRVDEIKTIILGILTVVIIGISRNSRWEMMNAEIFLLVVISFFFFDIYFHHNIKAINKFHFILVGFALLEVIWGYCQLYVYIPELQTDFRLRGSFNSAYAYALFLATVAPIALYWTITLYQGLIQKLATPSYSEQSRSETIDEIMLFLLSALGLIGIATILPFTGKWIAWFTAACGCGLILYFKLNIYTRIKSRYLQTRKQRIIFPLIVFLIACCSLGGYYKLRKDAVDEQLLSWKISMNVLSENPLFGIGIGNFQKAFGDAQSDYFAHGDHDERELSLANTPKHPISDIIRITAATGFLGLLLILGLIGTILVKGFRDLKGHPEKLAILGALVTFSLAGILSSPLKSLPLAIVLTLLLVLCTPRAVRNEKTKLSFNLIYLVLAGIAIMCTYPRLEEYKTYRSWANGKRYYDMKIYAVAVNIYTPLTKTLKHPNFLFEYGQALSQIGRYEDSITVLQEVSQSVSDPMIYNIIGKNYQAMGEYKLAEQNFRRAHYMTPSLVYSNYLLANLYHEMGLHDETLQCAQQVITQKTKKESKETQEMKKQMESLIRSIH